MENALSRQKINKRLSLKQTKHKKEKNGSACA